MKETVTVVIPFYNANKYLSETLDSILLQRDVVVNVIIVQDRGSEAPEIDERFRSIVTVICNGTTFGGAGVARWVGVGFVSGDWVAFCDADDVWSESKLADQIFHMKSHRLDFSFCGFAHFDHKVPLLTDQSRVFMPQGPFTLENFLKKRFVVACFTVLVSKRGADLIKPNRLRRRNDYLMWFNLIGDLEAQGLAWGGVSGFGGWHRLHENALTSSKLRSVFSQYVFYRGCGYGFLASLIYMVHYLYRTVGTR